MPQELTEKEVFFIFKNVKVTFCRYYKYEFFYTAEVDGYVIRTTYGGDRDDIYKHEVTTAPVDFVNTQYSEPQFDWDYIEITRDGKTVFWKDRRM